MMNLGDRVVMNSNGIIAVSAPGSKAVDHKAGAVFVYARPQSGWTGSLTQSETVLSRNPEENGFFGAALAISQDYLIVGAYGEGSGDEGRVYIYGYTSGSPLYSHNFTIPNDLSSPGQGGTISNGEFGKAVAISDTIPWLSSGRRLNRVPRALCTPIRMTGPTGSCHRCVVDLALATLLVLVTGCPAVPRRHYRLGATTSLVRV